MNKLIVLNIDMCYGETHDIIHPVVLCDETNYVLVDCGYVGSLSKIEDALICNNVSPELITHIILTHQDHDHIGAAAAYKKKYPNVQIVASAKEAPFISGTEKYLRLNQAEKLQRELPAEMQEFGIAFCNLLRSVEPVAVDQLLYDNELLPFCGGCRVIATPGHTPGHISLYVSKLSAIISGDALALERGQPVIANPQFTLNIEEATTSMLQLLSFPAKKIICYHGGVLERESDR